MTELTQVADPEVMAQWRRGPRWYWVVAALFDEPAATMIESRRLEVLAACPDLLTATAPGQPHVTLWVTGFGEPPRVPALTGVPGPRPDDAERTRSAGRAVSAHPDPEIALTIGGAATFRSAAYLTVSSPAIQTWRGALAEVNPAEQRWSPYVPHLTIGLYRAQVPLAAAERRLSDWSHLAPVTARAVIRRVAVDTRSPVGALVTPGHGLAR